MLCVTVGCVRPGIFHMVYHVKPDRVTKHQDKVCQPCLEHYRGNPCLMVISFEGMGADNHAATGSLHRP